MTAGDEPGTPSTRSATVESADPMDCYLRSLHHAYRWGAQQALLRRRLDRLCRRASTRGAAPEDVDELLAAWQALRAFPADRPSLPA